MSSIDASKHRKILAAARMQYSSDTRPLRDIALDGIVTNIIYSSVPTAWMNRQSIQAAFRKDSGGHHLDDASVDRTLFRLLRSAVIVRNSKRDSLYQLSDASRSKTKSLEDEASRRIRTVLKMLFEGDVVGHGRYEDPFMDVVARIFGVLGEESAQVAAGDRTKFDHALKEVSLDTIISGVLRERTGIDKNFFSLGIQKFFKEPNPEFGALQWTIAQNIFVTRMLGISEASHLLSDKMFEGATLYVDTNLIIPLLEPSHPDHESTVASIKSCAKLGVVLVVSKLTLDELESVIEPERRHFERFSNAPYRWLQQTDSIFRARFEEASKENTSLTEEDLFSSFTNARSILERDFGISIVEEETILSCSTAADITELAAELKKFYDTRRTRLKPFSAALHDSKILIWIAHERTTTGKKCWLLTADGTLPLIVPEKITEKPLAITNRIFLQWISPSIHLNGDSADYISAFSQLVRDRVLPRQQFMSAGHFAILLDANVNLDSMPDEDIERAVSELTRLGPNLDPSNAEDREKINLTIRAVLSDPTSMTQRRIAEIRDQLESTERREQDAIEEAKRIVEEKNIEIERERARAEEKEREVARVREESKEREQELVAGHKDSLRIIDNERTIDRKHSRENVLHAQGVTRLSISAVIWIVGLVLILLASQRWGAGPNSLQQIKDFLPFFGIWSALMVVTGGFTVGRDRGKLMGDTVMRILRIRE